MSKAGKKKDSSEIDEIDIRGTAQNVMSRFQKACKDIAKEPVAKQAVIGGASGWVVGYLSMKIGKAAATVVGGGLILMQLASHQGYITIDWRRVNKDLEKNAKKLQKEVEMQVNGNKAQSSVSRGERAFNRTVEKIEKKLVAKSEDLMSSGEGWLRRQCRKYCLTQDERTIDLLYNINVYLISFWAGAVVGKATGGVF
ncbi:FUN14 domain-containing protein 1-like [Hyalella azteca]|uniref:FUN14 domain-containing protein 1-like n=1 Tax=Hyalella azteca TaxID=294128 RepID=A0A8B7NRE0_HYAAZ|nr:FUN14 domain-containing protein 1-like [Hyalella azteca]